MSTKPQDITDAEKVQYAAEKAFSKVHASLTAKGMMNCDDVNIYLELNEAMLVASRTVAQLHVKHYTCAE